MKALMFGWEFPPHILGGLGTASYGLTRGMAMQPDMDITFCIPKPWGDEDQSFLKIIGVCNVPIVWRDVDMEYVKIACPSLWILRNIMTIVITSMPTFLIGR